MILSGTSPKVHAYVYLCDFYNSERNMLIYLLGEINQKRWFSVGPPSRFDRGVYSHMGGFIGYYRGAKY